MAEILIFTGSRSEWGLLQPLADELIRRKLKVKILASGSHLSHQFGYTYNDFVDDYDTITAPILADGNGAEAVCQSMGLGFIYFPSIFLKEKPKIVVILGDRFESLTCAICAYNCSVPIAHIQGTDHTWHSLDEGYRRCIHNLATLRFPATEYGSLGCVFPKTPSVKESYDGIVVYHTYKGRWEKEFYALLRALEKYKNLLYIGSNADSGGRQINQALDDNHLNYVKSLTRPVYLAYLKKARFIIGNSSSGIIEAPSLCKWTINVGKRQTGRMMADIIINVKADKDEVDKAIEKTKSTLLSVKNPYAKKDTLSRIAEKIEMAVAGR